MPLWFWPEGWGYKGHDTQRRITHPSNMCVIMNRIRILVTRIVLNIIISIVIIILSAVTHCLAWNYHHHVISTKTGWSKLDVFARWFSVGSD